MFLPKFSHFWEISKFCPFWEIFIHTPLNILEREKHGFRRSTIDKLSLASQTSPRFLLLKGGMHFRLRRSTCDITAAAIIFACRTPHSLFKRIRASQLGTAAIGSGSSMRRIMAHHSLRDRIVPAKQIVYYNSRQFLIA